MAHRSWRLQAIAVLAVWVLACPALAPSSSPAIQKLKSLIDKGAGLSNVFDEVPQAAVDAGPEAIPMLRGVLSWGQKEQGDIAAVALAFIGGEPAVDLLWQRYRATKDPGNKTLLAIAMSSARLTTKRRAFLEDCLQGEHFGTEWMPAVSAAFSLGVLRASDSREALEKNAKEGPGSIASGAAEEALRWIAQGYWTLEASSLAKIEPPIAAVLRNGVPGTERAGRFFDPDRHLYWTRDGTTWRVREGEGHGEVPSLSFRVHTSPDGKRATVSVGVRFGPQNGVGYMYVLRKAGSEWKVQSVVFIWIS